MFNLTRSSADQGSGNMNANTPLPSDYGSIRTLKKDFEDFKSGKGNEDLPPPLAAEPTSPVQKAVQSEAIPESANLPVQFPSVSQNASPVKKNVVPDIPRKNNSYPDLPVKPKNNLPKNQNIGMGPGIPAPIGSDSFYQEQPPFENVGEELNKQAKASSQKSSGKLGAILAVILILLLAGGATYYWWFYIKNQNNIDNSASQQTPPPDAAVSDTNAVNQQIPPTNDTKFKQWVVDLTSDKIAIKLALKRYISEFVAAASENDIIEAKLISSSGQPIEPAQFQTLFNFELPASISGNISNEYSLFVKKEENQARMGAAFKLSQSAGISQSTQREEGSLVKNLMSFYLDAPLADPVQTFNSSKYKSADIRYFNFSSPPNTSFDYTFVTGQNDNYFIFATSKETMRSILDYMSEK